VSLKSYYILLTVIGLLIYFPVLSKGFKYDDFPQIVNYSQVHLLKNIPQLFLTGFKYPTSHVNLISIYYKPLMFTFFTILYFLGHGSPFPFHLFQLLIYISNSVLIFIIFLKFWEKKLSFLLSFLFLIFPGSVEVASYIANLQDSLFLFFGLLALVFVQEKKINEIVRAVLIAFFLLCSILSKETGIIFFVLVPLYTLFFKIKKTIKYFFASLVPLATYIYLRAVAIVQIHTSLLDNHVQHLNLLERVGVSISVIGFYVQDILVPTIRFPKYLIYGDIPLLQVVAYFLIDLTIATALIFFAIFLKKKKSKNLNSFYFFSLWFFIGIIFHSQLFFSLDILATTRWLYLPLVGALGIAGSLVSSRDLLFLFKNKIFNYALATLIAIYALEAIHEVIVQ